MKSLTIEWDILREGEFPVAALVKCGLAVEIIKIHPIKQQITLTPNNGESFTHEDTYYLGRLIASELYLRSREADKIL